MPIDSSIAMGYKAPDFGNPINSLANIMQLQGAQQQNQLNQMKMDEYGRGVERTNALHSLLSGDYATPEARQAAMLKGGFLKEASDYAKGNADIAKSAAESKVKELEAANKRIDLAGSVFGYVRQNPTPENAFAALDHLATNGIYTPEQVAEYKAKIQANPQAVAQMADLAFRGALSAKEQLAKMGTVSAGDRVVNQAVDPVSGAVTETGSTTIKESEAERLRREQSARESAAGRAQSERHFQTTQAAGKVPAGYRSNPDGSMSFIPGGPADPNVGGGKMTEDQGKATGWLVQAENAYKNMMAVGKDKEGKPTSAARPGFNDALAAIPSFGLTGAAANLLRGADRQKFMQATSSLSEALLRAATGAGVNKEEAAQKIAELTPQFGESEETTKQKYDAIPLYIESLKVRAGPGAKKAATVLQGSSGGFKYLGTE